MTICHLQHARLDDPARVRRRALHARRAGDRGRLDQGVPRPDHRLLHPRALPRPAARRAPTPTSAVGHDGARRDPGQDRGGARARWTGSGRSPSSWPTPRSVLFLGRHVGYPIAMEGALKLKELAYIHAEGFAAGELKHGPIALIEPGQPVFVIVPSPTSEHGAARQGRLQHPGDPGPRRAHARHRRGGRRGRSCPFADEVICVPRDARRCSRRCSPWCRCRSSPCELSTAKGLDVDQPRNLAKSVTVE